MKKINRYQKKGQTQEEQAGRARNEKQQADKEVRQDVDMSTRPTRAKSIRHKINYEKIKQEIKEHYRKCSIS